MPEDRIENILVIRACALGDFILTLPMIRALRERFPGARLEIMGYPHILSLAEGRYYADRIESIDRADMAPFFFPGSTLPEILVTYFGSFDLIIQVGCDRDGLFARNLHRAGVGCLVSASPFPAAGERVHITEYLLGILKPLGINGSGNRPRVFLLPDDRLFASRFWDEQGIGGSRRAIVIHPGSGGRRKVWSLEGFSLVADWAAESMEASVLIISGPADGDNAHRVAGLMKKRPIIVEGLSVLELASVLERCDIFVGNDSGVTHLSWAVGTKTLAIFGPTDPSVWGPRGEGTAICKRGENLDLVRPGDVVAELEELSRGKITLF